MFTGTLVLFITLHSVLQIHGATTKHGADDKIIFPGPIQEVTLNRYGGSDEGSKDEGVPDECKNKNYCTIKPPDYPQKKFDSLIKHRIPLNQPTLDGLEDKQGDPDEVDNCESIVEFEPLYKVRAETGGWRTVVQSPEKNFVQLVRLETCREAMAPCFTVFPMLPTYTTFCKQKFTTWHFVVDVDTPGVNKTETIRAQLPTCCSCFYKPV
ncbi:hypothetical protein ABMA27_000700 [Loxostege sticticalis]|uniref:Spaetzle domain-containing protein n=1 Tax=Loxostege sticticalis TaxID=481309 RepID=A0ABR3I017_LOXSC